MSNKIKVALLTHAGGAHVTAYLSALAAADACESVVLADPDGRWNDEAKSRLGDKLIRTDRDHKRLLVEEKPAVALITYEAKLAPPILRDALEAGCHVFAEKPSCVSASEFEPLVEKADSSHRNLMLALANRTNPEIVEAKRLISAGQIGKLYGVEMHLIADQTRLTRLSYQKQWFAQKNRAGGGHLIWLGIHWLDLAMHVSGSSIEHVTGSITNVGGQPIDVEDSAVATLKFDNGMLGTMTSGYYLDRGYHSHIKFWGSHGWLLIESMKETPLTWYSRKGENSGKVQIWDGDKNPRGYTPFVSAAIKACADMSDAPISSAHSLRALKTVFAIYKSAESNKAVSVM